jgi:urea transporter
MSAYATCKFPFVDKWKAAADKNAAIGFIDSILSGYAQIAFSDNPVTGLLFIAGCCVGSVQMGISSLTCALTATLAAYLLGVPRLSLRLGLYTFNAALAGMGMALFIFPGQGVTPGLLLYAAAGGLLCVAFTAALTGFLSKWSVPPMALPYCIVLVILIPASLFLSRLGVSTSVIPYLNEMAAPVSTVWTAGGFFTAFMNSFSEILWQANVISGVFFLLGVLVSSRIDFMTSIIGSLVGTLFAIALGLPEGNISAGIYGYNSVLIMLVLFGRGYALSARNFIFSLFMALMMVLVVPGMAGILAPLGIPVASFPYVLVAIGLLASRDALKGLVWVDPLKWGVPETIAAQLKKEAA